MSKNTSFLVDKLANPKDFFQDKKSRAFLLMGENKMLAFSPSAGGLFGPPTALDKKP